MGGRIRCEGYVMQHAPPQDLRLHRTDIVVAYRDASGRLHEGRDRRRLSVESWLLMGMTVPIEVDPSRPGEVHVLLDEVPPLSRRIADNDPSLWDRRVIGAHVSRLRLELDAAMVPGAPVPVLGPEVDEAEERRRAAEGRTTEPVVDADGRMRGTADLISHTPQPKGGEMGSYRGHRIIRIWLYGYGPYAVLDTAHIWYLNKRSLLDPGDVPVSVSPDDRTDVRFLWDEWDKTVEEDLRQRAEVVAERSEAQLDHMMSAMTGQLEDAMRARGFDPASLRGFDAGATGAGGFQMPAGGFQMPDAAALARVQADAQRYARLQAAGVEMRGRVVSAHPAGAAGPAGVPYEFRLALQPPGAAAYELTVTQSMNPADPVGPGDAVLVRVDPQDPMSAAIWGRA